MEKDLIVGANSFLAQALTQQLLTEGRVVEGIINQNRDKLYSQLTYFTSDQLEELRDDYTTVYLISAYIPAHPLPADWNIQLYKTNIDWTKKVIKQFPSAKIVYASSVSVYGKAQGVIDEATTFCEPNAYGISKYWGELLVQEHPKHAIVRISSMYGVGMKVNTFLPRVIQQALRDGVIKVWGKGERQQNYIGVNQVAAYLYAASQTLHNGLYLAVANESYSNLKIAQQVQKYTGANLEFVGEDHSCSYLYNNSATREELGNIPQTNLATAIEDLIQWIKKIS
ncbi:MAG: NAD(P)-dependent oxidoreductase [Saprospiraceae bacterium]|nr:NAD(P)-dependent oxidoreductase [Saprospiraceae bacterium]